MSVQLIYRRLTVVCLLGLCSVAEAQPVGQPVDSGKRTVATPAIAQQAAALLSELQTNRDANARLKAAEELIALGSEATPTILRFLTRKRTSTDSQRRSTLGKINAQVPNLKGKFRTPGRRTPRQIKAADELDWLKGLAALPSTPGLPDVLGDVAALRALAATKTVEGAKGLLDFAFSKVGLTYRDECGRYLRIMAPYSVPTLIRATGISKKKPKWSYSRYQLERLDRLDAKKALHSARIDEKLVIEVLNAFRDVHYRDAVSVILATTNDVSPAVRRAARQTWLAYVTGPPPPEAPKRHLLKPGRRMSPKKVPLWLTYRQLADIELNAALERIPASTPNLKASLEARSNQLFAYYDGLRNAKLEQVEQAAQRAISQNDFAQAVSHYDQILALDPNTAKRPQMAEAFIAYAKALEAKKQHAQAAQLFGKAHALAPNGPSAQQALASYNENLKHAEKQPNTQPPSSASRTPLAAQGTSKRWMLVGAAAGGILSLLMLVIGIARRKQT